MTTEEPLIFTSKGNMLVSDLEYRHGWFETDNEISFIEEYLLDGEVVKRSVHSRLKRGLDAALEQQIFG
jgi:hypothetical protein